MSKNPLLNNPVKMFLVIAAAIFLLQIGVDFLKEGSEYIPDDWFFVYLFLIPVSVAGLYFIQKRYEKSKKITSIGKNYLVYTTFKMILSVVFLLPWLLNKDESSKPMVINFFIVFFPFLLVETWLLVRLLNNPLDEKMKNEENQGE